MTMIGPQPRSFLDPNAVPVDTLTTRELDQILVTKRVKISDVNRTYYGSALDMTTISQAIQDADRGYMVRITDIGSESIQVDPTLAAALTKRFGSLKAADWDVTPAQGVDRSDRSMAVQLADEVRSLLEHLYTPDMIETLAWALWNNRAAMEVHWTHGAWGFRFAPYALEFVHPRRLSYGANRELRVIDAYQAYAWFSSEIGEPVEDLEGKFLFWKPRLFNEYQEREGLLRRGLYWSFFKRFGQREGMKLLELFTLPWRIMSIDKDAVSNPEDIKNAKEQLEDLGGETTAVLPKGAQVNLEWPGEASGDLVDLHYKHCNDEINKLILGNTSTSDSDANRATAIVGKGEQDILFQCDGNGLSERLKPLIRQFVRQNHGASVLHLVPKFQIRTSPQRDRDKELGRVRVALGLGLPIAEAELREITGFRAPIDDEAFLHMSPSGGTDAQGNPLPGAIEVTDPNKPAQASALDGEPGELDAEPKTTPEEEGTDEQAKAALKDMLGLGRTFDAKSKTGPMSPANAVYGSPEVLVAKGTKDGARITDAWASALAEAANGTSSTHVRAAIERAAADLDLEGFARQVERRLVHGAMLGALDADWEAENDRIVKPPAFSVFEAPRALVGGVPDFVATPFLEAIKIFKSKAVVQRRTFDRLSAEAKRRAFTISGLARDEMISTAKDEIAKALEDGDDFSRFSKRLSARFDSAGWTKLNPSHVETIFRTATMNAYADGRHVQMSQPSVLAARPYWQILGVDDPNTRASHKHAHGKVLRADDPFWSRAPLIWGFACRCRKVSRSEADVKRLGLTVVAGSSLTGLPDEGWNSSGSLL